jgi:hypothetical protein
MHASSIIAGNAGANAEEVIFNAHGLQKEPLLDPTEGRAAEIV